MVNKLKLGELYRWEPIARNSLFLRRAVFPTHTLNYHSSTDYKDLPVLVPDSVYAIMGINHYHGSIKIFGTGTDECVGWTKFLRREWTRVDE